MRQTLSMIALALPLLISCKGEQGATCKEDDDCNGALICCPPGIGRGVCEMSCDVITDSGPEDDVQEVDAGEEDAPVADGIVDAVDDVMSDDVGPEDAGVDAGDDAGVDAGVDAGDDAGVDAGDDAGT